MPRKIKLMIKTLAELKNINVFLVSDTNLYLNFHGL